MSSADISHARLMRAATWASVIIASALIAAKSYAWLHTGSMSMLSSLTDSVLDVTVSLINFIAVRYALMPPDDDHRFGHSGAEDIAALAQSTFICGSAMFIIISALGSFDNVMTHELRDAPLGIGVMIFSIISTFLLVTFQKYVVRKTGSTAIDADFLHYVGDLLMNVAVIISYVLAAYMEIPFADPIFAILIALYMMYSAAGIGRKAMDNLMDRELDDDKRSAIQAVIMSYKEVLGMHELKTRRSGVRIFVQVHIELDATMSLYDAHEVADNIEEQIKHSLGASDVIIHQDPVRIGSEPAKRDG